MHCECADEGAITVEGTTCGCLRACVVGLADSTPAPAPKLSTVVPLSDAAVVAAFHSARARHKVLYDALAGVHTRLLVR